MYHPVFKYVRFLKSKITYFVLPPKNYFPSEKRPNFRYIQKNIVPNVAHKWKELAIQFGFDKDGTKASKIQKNHFSSGGVELCCTEACLEWLNGKGRKPPSWEELIRCLEAIQLIILAHDIRENLVGK